MLFSGVEPSNRYQLSKEDLLKAGQVLLWSVVSALVGTVIVLIGQFDIPTQYLFLVPIVNTVLVALKKFVDKNLQTED